MASEEDDDAADRLRRLGGNKQGDGRRSKGNPPKGWKKAHPLPKKKGS
jgi:hypothetical protein